MARSFHRAPRYGYQRHLGGQSWRGEREGLRLCSGLIVWTSRGHCLGMRSCVLPCSPPGLLSRGPRLNPTTPHAVVKHGAFLISCLGLNGRQPVPTSADAFPARPPIPRPDRNRLGPMPPRSAKDGVTWRGKDLCSQSPLVGLPDDAIPTSPAPLQASTAGSGQSPDARKSLARRCPFTPSAQHFER